MGGFWPQTCMIAHMVINFGVFFMVVIGKNNTFIVDHYQKWNHLLMGFDKISDGFLYSHVFGLTH